MPRTRRRIAKQGYRRTRRGDRVGHRIFISHEHRSPFVHGMARTVDVGGILRDVDIVAARRAWSENSKALKCPDTDSATLSLAWDAVGGYFRRVIGPVVGGGATPIGATRE